jgi:hypothetical protein
LERQGIGAGLLNDAMLRPKQAVGIAGIRAYAAHVKDDAAQAFYEHIVNRIPAVAHRSPAHVLADKGTAINNSDVKPRPTGHESRLVDLLKSDGVLSRRAQELMAACQSLRGVADELGV